MTLYEKENGEIVIIKEEELEEIRKQLGKVAAAREGENGFKFVDLATVNACFLHLTDGNSKTGKAWNFNLPIEYSCTHCCECYKRKLCYAMQNCYNFTSNQIQYSENLAFFINHSSEQFVHAVNLAIASANIHLYRWFTCGDIYSPRFFACMVQIAIDNPTVKFWAYTKRYATVNNWIRENGELPKNLRIIFSHWMNEDGSYFPMENPYNLPTSEFVPMGREDLLAMITHVCPCSDPNSTATCATCDRPCYELNNGESMGLCEHSTAKTKKRDNELREAKKAAKAAAREAAKAAKAAAKAGKQGRGKKSA